MELQTILIIKSAEGAICGQPGGCLMHKHSNHGKLVWRTYHRHRGGGGGVTAIGEGGGGVTAAGTTINSVSIHCTTRPGRRKTDITSRHITSRHITSHHPVSALFFVWIHMRSTVLYQVYIIHTYYYYCIDHRATHTVYLSHTPIHHSWRQRAGGRPFKTSDGHRKASALAAQLPRRTIKQS